MTEVSVLVDSRGGNTRKVADAIAGEVGITAMDVAATPKTMHSPVPGQWYVWR